MKPIFRAVATVVPIFLGMGVMYLYAEGILSLGSTAAVTFAMVAICFTAAYLDAAGAYESAKQRGDAEAGHAP